MQDNHLTASWLTLTRRTTKRLLLYADVRWQIRQTDVKTAKLFQLIVQLDVGSSSSQVGCKDDAFVT